MPALFTRPARSTAPVTPVTDLIAAIERDMGLSPRDFRALARDRAKSTHQVWRPITEASRLRVSN